MLLGSVIFAGCWYVWVPLICESFALVAILIYLALAGLVPCRRRHDERFIRECLGFIVRTSPPLGLAGTLIGLSHGFGGFTGIPDPERVLGAMATAAYTTLAGIFLMLAASEALRLLLRQRKGKEEIRNE